MTSFGTDTEPRSHLVSDPQGLRFVTDTTQRTGKVVMAIDGSAASAAVFERGIRLANALHTSLEAVTSWTYPAFYGTTATEPEYAPENDAIQILEEASKAAYHGQHPDWVTLLPLMGPAAEVLIEASKGAEMLIVGSRGHGGVAGLLLGSVSAECAERAACPVLVIH
jgi:nucleotide-binding universal stress UspA family protein